MCVISNYLVSSAFMVIILSMIWVRSSFSIRDRKSLRCCRNLVLMTIFYVVMDALFITCDFVPSRPDWVFNTVVFFFYIVYVLLPFFWHRFVRNYVGRTLSDTFKKIEYIPMVLLLAMVIATPFSGALWSLDGDGKYVRGPLFLCYTYLNYFYYVDPALSALVVAARGDSKKEPYLLSSILISIIPLVGAAINNLVIPIYEVFPFQPFCSVIVALTAYFFMAARESDTLQAEQRDAIQQALDKAMEAEQKAVEASNVKSTFLSNMSHDIRTPMNAIINLTQLAQQESDIAVIREYLAKMSISGNFLLGLINDVLDMSKIESGELELHKENLTRSEFLDTVETVVRPLMDAKHINFHSELDPGEYTIFVDKLRFNQIFFNLLSNASKFTPEGGDVWFTVTNLEAENGKLKIRFVVRDNGIGMSEEFQKHMFEPFAREHSVLSDESQGTGLGLSIVKSLVDAMDGTITVESKLGEGTEFDVTFYVDIVARRELDEANAPRDLDENLNGMRVLLVEDNETNIYVAQIILENAGCVVTTAKNGQIAVDTFSASSPNSFDAILMDIRMPVMDGIEATKTIRRLERPDAATVPIIAMTADAFDSERKQTLDAGMNYHLAKPVDAHKLYKVLAQCGRRTGGKSER